MLCLLSNNILFVGGRGGILGFFLRTRLLLVVPLLEPQIVVGGIPPPIVGATISPASAAAVGYCLCYYWY